MKSRGSQFDGDPLDNSRVLAWVLRIMGVLQIPLGMFGSLGAYALLTGDPRNPETYEIVMAPVMAWLVSLPVVLASYFVYLKCRSRIGLLDRIWFIAWSTLPSIALAVAGLAVATRF